LYFNNGNWYDGEWKNNFRDGEGNNHIKSIGTMFYANGKSISGYWKNDVMTN